MVRRASTFLLALLALGCSHATPRTIPAELRSPFTGYRSSLYAQPQEWLCRPDLPSDPCRAADLSATVFDGDVLDAEGHRPISRAPQAKDPGVDCFYVYPTVDLRLLPGNHSDFSDLERIRDVTLAQVGRFRTVCRMFVPLYRQVTIGTYGKHVGDPERYFAVAASDVEDAFLHYMGQYNHGRPVLLIGHSQGAEMITRLLRRHFDADPAMQERLVAALVIGGRLTVAKGRATGGTFAHLPICGARAERHCVVAYRSYRDGTEIDAGPYAPPPGQQTPCVNPAGPDHGQPLPFEGALFPRQNPVYSIPGMGTPYFLVRHAYAGRCVLRKDGFGYLAVSSVTPAALHPIDLESRYFNGLLGLHVLDYQLPQDDLLNLVREKFAATQGAPEAP